MSEKIYIGTKIIAAEPMYEHQFLAHFKLYKRMPAGDNREGYKVRYEDGYISWSPKETFDGAYREITESEQAIIGG